MAENKQANKGFEMLTEIRNILESQNSAEFEIGKMLLEFRDGKRYLDLGYDRWVDFANSGDISLKKSMIYNHINAYQVYIVELGFQIKDLTDIAFDKLLSIISIVRQCTFPDAKEWVEKARTLSRSDLALEIDDWKHKDSGDVKSGDKEALDEAESKTKLVKAFLCDECGKWRIDMNKDEICEGHI